MPKSKGRKKKPPARQRAKRSPTVSRLPPMASLVRPVLDGGRELLDMADPLDVEMWASDILSLWFKVPLPLVDQEEFERKIRNQIVRSAETKASAEAVAVLCAFTAMEPDPIARPATDAIARLTARGAVLPPWAEALNDGPEQVSGWMLTHPFGDQDGYHLDFRYPGHEAHTIVALIDKNIGGICKDAVCGIASDTIRARAEADGDVDVRDVDPIEAAPAILQAIEIGDQYIDNDWTPEFKTTRALLRARMHRLARDRRPDIREPLTDQKRDAIVGEFCAKSARATRRPSGSQNSQSTTRVTTRRTGTRSAGVRSSLSASCSAGYRGRRSLTPARSERYPACSSPGSDSP